jgi:hypothetical protein
MSKKNYNTTRNKEKIIYPSNSLGSYKLTDEMIKKLRKNKRSFNSWEEIFYKSLTEKNYKISSEKQWLIIKQLLNK